MVYLLWQRRKGRKGNCDVPIPGGGIKNAEEDGLSLVLLLSGLFVSVAPAWPPSLTIWLINPPQAGPISGTNVRVGLEVTGCDFHWPHPVHAVLNGILHERLRCIPDPGYPPSPSEDTIVCDFDGHWAGIVVIDSTGWDDGTAGGLLIRIAANGPRDSNAIPQIHVQNEGLVLGYGEDERPDVREGINQRVAGVRSRLEGMKHIVCDSTSLTKEQMLTYIPFFTVFYYAGHDTGTSPFRFWACVGGSDPLIADSEVNGAVINMNPRYNLAYMDCCHSGEAATAYNMFWNPDEPSEDTCYFGWDGFMYYSQAYKNYTLTFFAEFGEGWTAEAARDWASFEYEITNGCLFRDYENFRLHWPYLPPSPW